LHVRPSYTNDEKFGFGKIRPEREDIGNVKYTGRNRNVAMHGLGELRFTK
jgi:hypothetical protein